MCSKCKLHSSVWRRVCWLRQQSHPHWQCGCVYLCVLLWAIGFPICCQPILYCDCQASTCGPDGPQHPFLCFMVHDNTMFRVDVVVNNNTHFYECWYPCVFSPRICAQCVRLFVRCYPCRGGWGGHFSHMWKMTAVTTHAHKTPFSSSTHQQVHTTPCTQQVLSPSQRWVFFSIQWFWDSN